MNNSQLLYKIADLQYNIRLKEAEYSKAVKTNDAPNIKLSNETIISLKQALDTSVKQFNAVPPTPEANNKFKSLKEIIRRLSFVNIKGLVNKKLKTPLRK